MEEKREKAHWFEDENDLECFWEEYALADNDKLTKDAQKLKQTLLNFVGCRIAEERKKEQEAFCGECKDYCTFMEKNTISDLEKELKEEKAKADEVADEIKELLAHEDERHNWGAFLSQMEKKLRSRKQVMK